MAVGALHVEGDVRASAQPCETNEGKARQTFGHEMEKLCAGPARGDGEDDSREEDAQWSRVDDGPLRKVRSTAGAGGKTLSRVAHGGHSIDDGSVVEHTHCRGGLLRQHTAGVGSCMVLMVLLEGFD